jgi:hypothetical protein
MKIVVQATATALATAAIVLVGPVAANAAGNPSPTGTGQPSQTCGSGSAPMTPGTAAAAPGSAFNPAGHAGTVYAGEQPQNSGNPTSVSQYDVACFQVSQGH